MGQRQCAVGRVTAEGYTGHPSRICQMLAVRVFLLANIKCHCVPGLGTCRRPTVSAAGFMMGYTQTLGGPKEALAQPHDRWESGRASWRPKGREDGVQAGGTVQAEAWQDEDAKEGPGHSAQAH